MCISHLLSFFTRCYPNDPNFREPPLWFEVDWKCLIDALTTPVCAFTDFGCNIAFNAPPPVVAPMLGSSKTHSTSSVRPFTLFVAACACLRFRNSCSHRSDTVVRASNLTCIHGRVRLYLPVLDESGQKLNPLAIRARRQPSRADGARSLANLKRSELVR